MTKTNRTDLAETVARAMRDAYAVHMRETVVPWERSAPDVRAAWMVCARTAIAAIGDAA